MLNRDEKLPAVRLAFIQYAIAVILAILVFGLWRLQVVGGENYHALAEANRIRKGPDPRAARQALRPRRPPPRRQLSLRLLLPASRAGPRHHARSAAHLARPAHDRRADRRHPQTLSHGAQIQPLPLKQDITPDEAEFIEAHSDELPELETMRGAAPPLSARRLCRPPHRLRRRGQRGDAQRLPLRLL